MSTTPILTPERAREILAERARALARPLSTADLHGEGAIDVLTFGLARERYAVDARFVFAVFRLVELTPLPGARRPVVGVTRWRGDILTLIDLRSLLGARIGALDDLGRVLVLGEARPELGLLVDLVGDPLRLTIDQILPMPAGATGAQESSILRGVTRDALVVLDVPALLTRQFARTALLPAPTP